MNSGLVHVGDARTARMQTAAASQIPTRSLPARAAPQQLRASQHWPGADPGATLSHPATGLRPSQLPVAPIQFKPVISAPGGVDEREADDLADAVVQMPDRAAAGAAGSVLQRKCIGCEDEEEEEEEEEPVRTKHAPGAISGSVPDTGAAASAAGRGGTPLPPEVRSFFEPRFGRDFTAVRLHTGAEAAAGAQAVQARAYTIGHDVVFGAGEFAPDTSQGRWLLAHELAHTLQQAGTVPQGKIQRIPAGAGAAASTGTVRRGSHNERVRTLQERLNALGQEPPLKIDSIFGPLTEAATRAFQARNGLDPDGVAGPDTWAALEAWAAQPDIDPNEAALGQHAVDLMDQNNVNPHTLDQGVHYYYNYRALCIQNNRPDLWKDDYQWGYADPQYFDRIGFMDWRLKPGLSAAAALKSWLRGLTIAECNSAVVAIEIDSVRAAIGDTKFDSHWGSAGSNLPADQRLRIKQGTEGTPVANLMKDTDAAATGDAGTPGNRPAKPGEWYYFYNHPRYLLKHPGGAWQGENALYMGRDSAGNQLWSGMGASRVMETQMLDEMVKAYNADRNADDAAELQRRFPQGPPPEYDPANGEFPDKLTGPEEILSAPPYELDGTTRKGGFDVEAGTTLDEAKVKALANE